MNDLSGRGKRSRRTPFERISGFSEFPELSTAVRLLIDGIESAAFGDNRVWQVAAEMRDVTLQRTALELWAPIPGFAGLSTRGLDHVIDAASITAVARSPYATPTAVAESVWDLPTVSDVHQVRFTADDGTQWIDSWTVFPVFMGIPEHLNWSQLIDITAVDSAGQLHSETINVGHHQYAHCPFVVSGDDPWA